MRHLKKGRKFHRPRGERKAFLRNLANNLIRDEKIETTTERAKAIRPIVERWITIAKSGDLSSRRLLLRRTHNKELVHKLCDDLGRRYGDRKGGYLRIVKLGKVRKRDGAELARIEFV